MNAQRAVLEPRDVGRHTRVFVVRLYGLGECCMSPQPIRVVRRGEKLERCFNCGHEAPRE